MDLLLSAERLSGNHDVIKKIYWQIVTICFRVDFHPWPPTNSHSFCGIKSSCRSTSGGISGQQYSCRSTEIWPWIRCSCIRRSSRGTRSRFLEEKSYMERGLEEILGKILWIDNVGVIFILILICRKQARNKFGSQTGRKFINPSGFPLKFPFGKIFK